MPSPFRIPITHESVPIQAMTVECGLRFHLECGAWHCDCPCHGPDWEYLDEEEARNEERSEEGK